MANTHRTIKYIRFKDQAVKSVFQRVCVVLLCMAGMLCQQSFLLTDQAVC